MMRSLIFVITLLVAIWGLDHYMRVKKNTSCPDLSGRMVTREDPKYTTARLVSNYNTSKNKFPHSIIYARTAKDVQNAVLFAKCHNLSVRIRSGGHNHESYSTGQDALVIDVSEMKDVKVDPKTHIATIEPGLTNLELYSFLFKRGLTHAGGTCSDVGLSGLIASGGMGPFLRRVGLACDTLISAEVVDANGKIIRATKDNEHQDLFWALCGAGGGNFGIITSMQIQTYPADHVTWFNIGWDSNQNKAEVLIAWQDFFAEPDKQWFSHLDLWGKAFSSLDLNKQPIKVLGMYFGRQEEAHEKLAPFLNLGKPSAVVIEAVDWKKAIELIEESTATFVSNKPEYKSTGAFAMQKLPKEAIDILNQALTNSSFPLLNVLFFSMNGKMAEVKPKETAYYYRDAKFFINYSLQWLKEGEESKAKEELALLREKLLPFTVGNYIGNPDPNLKNYLTDYFGENVERLKCVKRKYDPENFFHFEQSIPPADKDCKS
ncbi:MAG TPA: FAD-binding oxidoreductase [Parachlamydiaceae bacterium]|nr:FAD-binding oxidoreductase [Parachlamydiaceae bacterium]